MTKKCIFELTEDQDKALKDYADENNVTKTDVIRIFCDALKGMDSWRTNIAVHDDKKIRLINPSDKEGLRLINSDENNITKINASITYEGGKPFTSQYTILEENIITFGGANNV